MNQKQIFHNNLPSSSCYVKSAVFLSFLKLLQESRKKLVTEPAFCNSMVEYTRTVHNYWVLQGVFWTMGSSQLCIKFQFITHRGHSPCVTKTLREIIHVYFENYTQHVNIRCWKESELLMWQKMMHLVVRGLRMV